MKNTGLFNAEGKALSIADVIAMLPSVTFLEKVNRVEVIDQNGRSNMKSADYKKRNYQFKTKVNMKTKTSILAVIKAFFILLVMCCLFYSCADVQPQVVECVTGHQYGFWGGLWHGMIAPFSFIGSLFSDDIAVWAINNNGGWYTFGFVLGIGALTKSSSKSVSK